MMKSYKILSKQVFKYRDYLIVPIRFEDRYEIMQWRNDQIDILRQKAVLTSKMQDEYFENVILKLFDKKEPNQILFSFLKNDELIGYGGLVHIDWDSKNAEISFLQSSKFSSEYMYNKLMNIYLNLIEEVAKSVGLHKIFTYGYDIGDYRFKPLIINEYNLEAILKEHVLIKNSFKDVKIYSKLI